MGLFGKCPRLEYGKRPILGSSRIKEERRGPGSKYDFRGSGRIKPRTNKEVGIGNVEGRSLSSEIV